MAKKEKSAKSPTLTTESLKKYILNLEETGGAVDRLQKSLKEVSGVFQEVDKRLSATNATVKIFAGLTRVLGSLPQQLAEINVELRKSTGFNEEYRKSISKTRESILDLGAETSKYGVTNKENLQTLSELAKENVKLLPIFEKNTSGLVRFSARMKAFGVDTKTSAELIGTLTSNLDMTQGQLDKTRRSLVSFANQTGQSIEKVVRDYSSSIKSFMDFLSPQEMNRSFMQFQVMARRMGTEANTLYGLATKFDTIEGAQQLGSRLNQTFSALGIEFNALAIQEMSPKQRIDYIAGKTREALKRARSMGGREGRLIMRSLADSGLGDFSQIRALGAEGGMRRASAFEMGGGMVRPMTADREAALARESNFENLEKALAEQRANSLLRQTRIYEILTEKGGLIDDLAGVVIRYESAVSGLKFAAAKAALESKAARLIGDGTIKAIDALLLKTKVGPEMAKAFEKAGAPIGGGESTMADVLKKLDKKLENLDSEQIKKLLKASGLAAAEGMQAGTIGAFTSEEAQTLKGLAKYLRNQQKSKALNGASATGG
tara:strand:+ start:3128 stop:4771 length:1644 start_codon:yes stop_codon:yes gene_type:complete